MGFPRQEYWSGLPFLSPGDHPDRGIKLRPSTLQVDSLPLSHQGSSEIRQTQVQMLTPSLVSYVVWEEGFTHDTVVKSLSANAEDTGDMSLIPGSGRSPGEGNGNPLQYSRLENPMDRGA